MKAQSECFECLRNQAKVWVEDLGEYEEFLDSLPKDCNGASISFAPPQIAQTLYGKIAQDRGVEDLYRAIKQECIQKAHQILSSLDVASLSIEDALKICVLGNVIDYGSASSFEIGSFDFESERAKLEFAYFDFEAFLLKLESAKSLAILGDNAGENLFDEVLAKVLKREYPHLKIYYFTRGKPIINDITHKDLSDCALCQEMFEITEVVDSGVGSAGFVYEEAKSEAQEKFASCDVIVAKGMGNFECMEGKGDERVFFLCKIKCPVVLNVLNAPMGKMVFKQDSLRI